MKRLFLLLSLIFIINSHAQFENMFTANGDANKYLSKYSAPVFNGFLYSTSSSWFRSAKALKPFHFKLDISAAGALIPDSETSFKFNASDYVYTTISSGSDIIPTILGGDTTTKLLFDVPVSGNEHQTVELNALKGVDLKSEYDLPANVVPAPNIQIGMGLPLGTVVALRYVPNIKSNGASFQQLGIGVQHSLSQYIPVGKDEKGKKKKRHFNLAVAAAFNRLNLEYVPNSSNNYKFISGFNTIDFEGIASFDYKFISFYGGVGYVTGEGNLDMKGSFDITYAVKDNNGNLLRTETKTITDPLKLKYNIGGMKTKLGVQFNLFVLRIFADYSIQKYPVVNAGIGFKI